MWWSSGDFVIEAANYTLENNVHVMVHVTVRYKELEVAVMLTKGNTNNANYSSFIFVSFFKLSICSCN